MRAMNRFMSKAMQFLVTLSLVFSYQVASAGTLTNVAVMPTDNLLSQTTEHITSFQVATAGSVKSITIAYPAGFTLSNKLVQVVRSTSAGTQSFLNGVLTVSAQSLIFTLGTATSLSAGDVIKVQSGNIVNSAALSNAVTVTTKNSSGTTIDSGSATLTLAQVITSMIADNSVTLSKLADLKSATYSVDWSTLAVGQCLDTVLQIPPHSIMMGVDLPLPGSVNALVFNGHCDLNQYPDAGALRDGSGTDYVPVGIVNQGVSPYDPPALSFTVWYLISTNP
jgi:hypothetical protein